MGRNVTEAATQEMGNSMIDLSAGACFGLADETYAESDPFHPEPTRGPTPKDLYDEAAAICARCSLRDLCLQDALTETVQWGYRAGMTPEDRQPLLRANPPRYYPSKGDITERFQLWESGWSDAAIAAKQGVNVKSIRTWRQANGHASNYINHRVHSPEQNALKLSMYEQGHTDSDIAAAVPCNADAIRKWRSKNGLKPNPARDRISA